MESLLCNVLLNQSEKTIITQLCLIHTNLTMEDINILEEFALQLPYIAELTGNDIFIDALTRNNIDAIVLAWARPKHKSLYSTSVVGQLAYSTNEPAVYRNLTAGETNRDIRGISQEGVPIAQTVVSITNKNNHIIGVLIMERDISKELWQEEKVELLSQTAEKLSRTLMFLSITDSRFDEWVGNAIFILNKVGTVTYANKNATLLFEKQCGYRPLGHLFNPFVAEFPTLKELIANLQNPIERYFDSRCYWIQAHQLVSYGELDGYAILLNDITDLRRKEQELNAKSLVIREIHHRVKNNLQNIASLLILQSNRSTSQVVKAEFADSINRIMSIAMVHDVFAHQKWESIDLLELSQSIVDSVMSHSSLPGHSIVTQVEGQSVQLSSRIAIPLALVINELVSNAIKHGIGPSGNGKINISVKEEKGFSIISVVDNGPKPEGSSIFQSSARSLGLQIVDSLVREQLAGDFRLERLGEVTRAMVYFPNYTEGEA